MPIISEKAVLRCCLTLQVIAAGFFAARLLTGDRLYFVLAIVT
jgi:hypothetical protein